MSETARQHRAEAPERLRAGVITVSDSKFELFCRGSTEQDTAGRIIKEALEKAGHQVVFYTVVPDHAVVISGMLEYAIERHFPEVLILTGGTGAGARDVTIEAVEAMFEKHLPGFGEAFRAKSVEEVGGAAMLTRATCGVVASTLVFALPGSPAACRLGMELMLPELGHMVKHVRE